MKILIVNATNSNSGAAMACKRLHLSLLLEGYESKLLVLNKVNDLKETYKFNRNDTILQKVVNKIKLSYSNYKYYRAYQSIESQHYLHSPAPSVFDITDHELFEWADVINLHWVSQFIDFSSFFKKCKYKPIIWTLHDMNPFTGGCHHSESCEKFKDKCEKCPQLPFDYQDYNHQNWLIKSKTDLKNLTIVSPSNWLKEISISSSLFRNLNHIVIPNALDISIFKLFDSFFCKSVFNVVNRHKTILFAAHNTSTPLKGIQYLLDALNLLEREVTLLIAGKTDIEIKDKDIVYLGNIQEEQLMALAYGAADVFVLPSLAENLPNVIIESLCCGTPVVAFDIGGNTDLIVNELNGLLVKQINSYDLSLSLDKALSINWDRKKISDQAQIKYNHKKQVETYTALFRKLI